MSKLKNSFRISIVVNGCALVVQADSAGELNAKLKQLNVFSDQISESVAWIKADMKKNV